MILTELQIEGMPKPFPLLYVMEIPSFLSKVRWRYTAANGEKFVFEAINLGVLLTEHFYERVILTDLRVISQTPPPQHTQNI